MQQIQAEVATTVSFLEGPTADAAGNVFFTETKTNRIMKFAPDGALTVFRGLSFSKGCSPTTCSIVRAAAVVPSSPS